jgi:hypothetical protein
VQFRGVTGYATFDCISCSSADFFAETSCRDRFQILATMPNICGCNRSGVLGFGILNFAICVANYFVKKGKRRPRRLPCFLIDFV